MKRKGRRAVQKNSTAFRVLAHLSTNDGLTSQQLKRNLSDVPNQLMDATLTSVKSRALVAQSERGRPYFLTPKGAALLRSFSPEPTKNPMPMPVFVPAPKAAKATNDGTLKEATKLEQPDTMGVTLFSELVTEHQLAKRTAEAIENLFQHWPR